MCDGPDLFLCVLSILFPPIGVWVKRGICSADSLINIALCCLGYLPGLLHAWYIIASYPDPSYEALQQDSEGAHLYYYTIHRGPPPPGGRFPQQQPGYGTVNTPDSQFPGQQSGTMNDFAQAQSKVVNQQPPRQQQATPQAQEPAVGSSSQPEQAPPSYSDVVKGDNKIQSQD